MLENNYNYNYMIQISAICVFRVLWLIIMVNMLVIIKHMILLMTFCTCCIIVNSRSQEYPSGSLACKTYNTSRIDCSNRNLVDIPMLDKNWTAMLDLSHNQLKEIVGSPFQNLSILTVLKLDHNMISILNSTAFTGLRLLLILDLSHNFLKALPSGGFSDLRKLIYFDITHNPLYDIPSKTLATLYSLQYLHLVYEGSTLDIVISDIRSLTRLTTFEIIGLSVSATNTTFRALASLPIQYFSVTWQHPCWDCHLDTAALTPFTSVRYLSIEFTALHALGSLRSPLQTLVLVSLEVKYLNVLNITTFQVLSNVNESLKCLKMFLPGLCRIENDAFIWTPNLVGIIVQHSQLQTLNKQAFRGLGALRWLILKNNQLTAVPSDALNVIGKISSFQHLDLSANSIFQIADDAFSGVSSLNYLNIKDNKFKTIFRNTGYLDLLRNLKQLVLGGLGALIHVFEFDLPVSLPSLQIFELRGTGIVQARFEKKLCPTFPNVVAVTITDTAISEFPYSLALHKCSVLEKLDLSGSVRDINSLDIKDANISIFGLDDLILARNELKSIRQILFINAPNLTSLNLSDNNVKNIDSAIAHAFKRLVHLSIDDNGLSSLAGLEHLTFLKHLNAARNQITEVPLWLISATTGLVLITLDLSGSPFSCTCEIEKFKKWIVSDTNTWLHPGEYTCASPESLKGISVSEVELDCRSHTAFYIGISIPFVILFCVLIIFLIRYRWHIKYKFFLLYRNLRPFPEVNEDFEMLQLQYHAYIAYNEHSEDDAWVLNELQPNMEEGPEPVQLCIKSRDFIPGHSLIQSISDNIQRSHNTILVLSLNFVESEWCYHELEMAKMRLLDENLDVIVLVLLKEIPNNKITLSLRQLLCNKEYLKWPKDKAGQRLFWQRLRQELKAPVQVDRRYCM